MKKGISIRRFMSLLLVILLCTGVTLTTTSCTLFSDEEEVSEAKEKKDKDKKKDKKKNKKKDKDKDKSKDKDKDKEPKETPSPEPTEEPDPVDEELSFANITLTVPKEWYGKYYVDEGDTYISFYQKASYDMGEGLGFLCGIEILDEVLPGYAGYTLIAYSDDKFYYMTQPTDVPCYIEDENISNEYFDMLIYKESMIDSMDIKDPSVCRRADDYIIPNSDKKSIPEYYCMNLNEKELWLARNEIFARYGMEFENSYLDKYFTRKPWYKNKGLKLTEEDISDIEKENLAAIKEAEAALTKSEYPKKLEFNKEYSEDLDGDGTKEKFAVKYKKKDYYYQVSISVNGEELNIEDIDEDAIIDTLETGGYYLTQIRPYFGELQIAILDWGPSDDQVTHYFDYEDNKLYYVDGLPGFTFKEYFGFNPFYNSGCVVIEDRADILETTYYFGEAWYDRDEHQFRDQTYGQCEIVGLHEHTTLKDIEVYTSETSIDTKVIPKGTVVYFISQDPLSKKAKIRTKQGVEGYLQGGSPSSDTVIAPSNDRIMDMFDNINFCD